jgi:hypothetical protein
LTALNRKATFVKIPAGSPEDQKQDSEKQEDQKQEDQKQEE